jgi:hypothetical protein
MRKILIIIISTVMPFSFVMADTSNLEEASKLKKSYQILDSNNYKYIPKDKRIPINCLNGIIEFSDGGFFCLEIKGKLTNKDFLKYAYTGTYYYPNGNFFTGKFFKGKKLEGKMDKSDGTEKVDCSGSKIFTCDTTKAFRYQKYFKNSDTLYYDVDYYLNKEGRCELRPYFLLASSYKKGWNKKSDGPYISEPPYKEARRPVNKDETTWCFDRHYTPLGPFFFKKIYLYVSIVSIPLALLLFYLIILSRRNNAIHNYNLKYKTRFKKYLDYKKHIDKIKLKELKKDEKRRSKLEKTPNLDDKNLMSKVKKLKSLYKNGTLNKAEFEKAKNKLLK